MFAREFGRLAETRIQAIMAEVDMMFSEKDTLTTELEIDPIVIAHLQGENWGRYPSDNGGFSRHLLSNVGQIAEKSQYEAKSYIFITGSNSLGGLGVAWLGTVCDKKRVLKVGINKYDKNDLNTAYVRVTFNLNTLINTFICVYVNVSLIFVYTCNV